MYKFIAIFYVSLIMTMSSSMSSATEKEPVSCGEIVTQTIETRHGKPGAPVTLTYQLPSVISTNSMINLNLVFRSTTPKGRLDVKINTDSGLELLSTDSAYFDLTHENMNMDVQLISAKDGLYYLNVNVKEYDETGAAKLGRSFAVPVQIGSFIQKQKNSGKIVDDGKEKIIEMIAD